MKKICSSSCASLHQKLIKFCGRNRAKWRESVRKKTKSRKIDSGWCDGGGGAIFYPRHRVLYGLYMEEAPAHSAGNPLDETIDFAVCVCALLGIFAAASFASALARKYSESDKRRRWQRRHVAAAASQ
jgi:hypothetical protein